MDPERLSDALSAAAHSLAVDQVTAQVIGALQEAGIEPILLKGPSFAQWLYEPGEQRSYVDTDALVAPADQQRAAEVLQRLGFVDHMAGAAAHEVDDHSRTFERAGMEVDLHFTLAGCRAHPEAVWRVLSARTEHVVVAGQPVASFDLPARAMHVALHAAQGDHGTTQPIQDLHRALDRTAYDAWQQAAGLAAALQATGAFVAGLERLPAGRDVLARLALKAPDAVYERLRTGSPPTMAMGLARLLERQNPRDARGIVTEIARELVPTPAFMRLWSPLARRGRLGLVVAYVWRPVSLVLRFPSALRAYLRARKAPESPV